MNSFTEPELEARGKVDEPAGLLPDVGAICDQTWYALNILKYHTKLEA